jgi:hypothetical protein
MQLISRDWLISVRDDHQREIGRPHAYAECVSGGDYPGDKSGESRYPFQVGVTVVGQWLQKGDSRGCPELYGVVQLQARVGEVSALFRTDWLPGPGVGGFGARFPRLEFHKTIQSEASPAYEH